MMLQGLLFLFTLNSNLHRREGSWGIYRFALWDSGDLEFQSQRAHKHREPILLESFLCSTFISYQVHTMSCIVHFLFQSLCCRCAFRQTEPPLVNLTPEIVWFVSWTKLGMVACFFFWKTLWTEASNPKVGHCGVACSLLHVLAETIKEDGESLKQLGGENVSLHSGK